MVDSPDPPKGPSGPFLSADEFARVHAQDRYSMEAILSQGRSAPEALWREVIRRYPELADAVAGNRTIPAAIRLTLARHPSVEARRAIAGRPDVDEPLLEELAGDPEPRVRAAAAFNPITPDRLRERLSADEVQLVADVAQRRTLEIGQGRAMAAMVPAIDGIAKLEPGLSAVAITLEPGQAETALDGLLAWLPATLRLSFYDRFHPSRSDPGAYYAVQRDGRRLVARRGNHGWSSDTEPVDPKQLIDVIAANLAVDVRDATSLTGLSIGPASPLPDGSF